MNWFNNIKHYLLYLIRAKSAHGIHSPFVYKFITEFLECTNESYYAFEELDQLRKKLLQNKSKIEITDFGAGSKIFKSNTRRICDIAKHGISKRKYSELYFKLVNYFQSKTIVELGTSLGLNTIYFAKANPNADVYTLEGCSELSTFSSHLFRENNLKNITLINKQFEIGFPELLNQIEKLDLLYVDGNHQYKDTLNYFELGLEKKHNESVFIFDDINWSQEMQQAWLEIKNHKEVTLSLDLYKIGIVFFRAEQKQKEHFVLKY